MAPRISCNLPRRIGHSRSPELNSLEYDYDKENVYCKGPICSNHKEKNHSESPGSVNSRAQWNAVHSKQMRRRAFEVQDRNVGWSYNSSASPRRLDLQVDVELKMKWTRERSKSTTNSQTPLWLNIRKPRCKSSPKAPVQNLHMWTSEKFERLQERIRLRDKLKDLLTNPSKQKPCKAVVSQLPSEFDKKLFSFYSRKSYSDSGKSPAQKDFMKKSR